MAEENSTPKYDDLDFRMGGDKPTYDPINEDITKEKPLTPPPIPQVEGIKPLDPKFYPSGTSAPRLPVETPNLSGITSQGLREKMQQIQIDGVDVKSDPWKRGKRMMVDLHDPNNQNQFYDRYAAHSDFEKLGFSPFRDNESLYNANSSWWEEMGRASGEFATLAGLGFKDAMGFGDLTDMQTAEEFEKAMAIGQSSKGGIGGFTTNLFLNSGYTIGIMGELAAEELAMFAAEAGLAFATGASAGTASGVTLPAMGIIGARMASRAASAFKKIGKAWDASKKLGKALGNLQDVSKARGFFAKAGAKTLDVLNPLENTVDFFKNADSMGDIGKLSKTAKGFGEFYKDVRNIRLAYGEGALEGGMVRNQITRDLIAEFDATHDRPMTKEESQKIAMAAEVAGKNTALTNMPLILLSNKMTFDGLVRGKFKNLSQSVIKSGKNGKILFDPKKAKDAFSPMAKNWAKRQWDYVKNPRLLLNKGGVYAKANFAEGLQELGQETVSKTFTDYEMAKYKGDDVRGGHYDFLAGALSEQASLQGLETFLSGFLMGGMVAPISNTVASTVQNRNEVKNLYKRAFKNEEWQEIKNKREEQLNKDVNKLNRIYNDPRQYFNADLENLQSQKEYQKQMKAAMENNDHRAMKDAQDGSVMEHVVTALQMGRAGTFQARLDSMLELTEEEAKEFDPTKTYEEFQQSVREAKDGANNVEKRWEYFSNKHKNPFNPFKYKKGSDQYYLEARKQHAWDNAIKEAVFYQTTFDRALERQQEITLQLKDNAGLKNTPYGEFAIVTDRKGMQSEIDLLKQELETLDENSKDKTVKEAVADKKAKKEALEEFMDAIDDMEKNPGENESVPDAQFNKLEKAYKKYITYLNKKNKDFSTVDNVDKSLRALIDWYKLEGRKGPAMNAVNILLDPEGFLKVYDRKDELNELKLKQKKAEIKESLEKYREKQEGNQMLNELADEGMFFDVSDLAKLEEEGVAPKEFYYINTEGEKEDQVVRNTDDYMKAIRILQKYLAVTKNIDITNESKFNPYSGQSREKNENDKRTYDDLAKQFGFDPKESNSKVPLKDVLQSIIDSEYATKADVELAKKLLEKADDKEFVTFSNREDQAGSYTEVSQTVIDARYSSNNFKYGEKGHPIEFIILKEEVGRRIQEALETDPEFKEQIESLREEALETWKKLSDEEKQAFFSGPFDVLTAQEFAKAAMTNETFQSYLATVSSKMSTKTVWQRFVDAVLAKMEQIFDGRPSGTVLNATLDVITAKLDIDPLSAEAVETTTPTTPTETETERLDRIVEEQRLTIPFDTIRWDSETRNNVRESGESNIIDMGGRKIIVLNINGLNVPFYLSTGSGGKKNVEAGKWYPFFGIGEDGWINKTTEEEINNYYNNATLKALAEALDRKIGDIREDNSVPKVSSKGQHLDIINKDMTPTENGNADTVTNLVANRDNFINKLSASKPTEQTKTEIKAEPIDRSVVPEAVKAAQKPLTPRTSVGGKMIPALRELGYSETDIANYKKLGSVAEVQRIIDNVIYKEDLIAEREAAEAPATDPVRQQQALDLRKKISTQLKLIADTLDYNVYLMVEAEFHRMVREEGELFDETGYTHDYLRQEMIILRDAIQNKGITFEELQVDDILVMNTKNEDMAQIIDIQGDTLILEYTDINRTVFVKKDELSDRVKFNFRQMEGQGKETPGVTEQENEASKETVTNLEEVEFNHAELESEVNSQSSEEVEDEFLNDIKNNCE